MKPKVKIIATLGPSTNNPESVSALIDKGVNVFRLNFSYGTHQEHEKTIRLIREISSKKGRLVGILQDICGPKIRIRGLKKPVEVFRGDVLKVSSDLQKGDFSISYPEILSDFQKGDLIFFADGTVQSEVIDTDKETLTLKILTKGILKEGKGVNFPKDGLSLNALTKKDQEDIRFGVKMNIDFIAISFVSSEKDIIEAKSLLQDSDAWIVAKIERKSAVEEIDKIIKVSDAIMVARGDLGAEIGLSRVPTLQKEIIAKSNMEGKPVITATQMLTSMINSPYPTRAEVSDIANALLDGTDAVMLSDETAIGNYPLEALDVIVETIKETQKSYPYHKNFIPDIKEAFPHAASNLSEKLPASFCVALTRSGYTLKHLSKFRPQKPIYCITPTLSLLNKTTLIWGVEGGVYIKEFYTEKELVDKFFQISGIKPQPFILVTGYLGEKISQGRSVRFISRF